MDTIETVDDCFSYFSNITDTEKYQKFASQIAHILILKSKCFVHMKKYNDAICTLSVIINQFDNIDDTRIQLFIATSHMHIGNIIGKYFPVYNTRWLQFISRFLIPRRVTLCMDEYQLVVNKFKMVNDERIQITVLDALHQQSVILTKLHKLRDSCDKDDQIIVLCNTNLKNEGIDHLIRETMMMQLIRALNHKCNNLIDLKQFDDAHKVCTIINSLTIDLTSDHLLMCVIHAKWTESKLYNGLKSQHCIQKENNPKQLNCAIRSFKNISTINLLMYKTSLNKHIM